MALSLFDTKAKFNSTLFNLIIRILNSHKSSVVTWQCWEARVAAFKEKQIAFWHTSDANSTFWWNSAGWATWQFHAVASHNYATKAVIKLTWLHISRQLSLNSTPQYHVSKSMFLSGLATWKLCWRHKIRSATEPGYTYCPTQFVARAGCREPSHRGNIVNADATCSQRNRATRKQVWSLWMLSFGISTKRYPDSSGWNKQISFTRPFGHYIKAPPLH